MPCQVKPSFSSMCHVNLRQDSHQIAINNIGEHIRMHQSVDQEIEEVLGINKHGRRGAYVST